MEHGRDVRGHPFATELASVDDQTLRLAGMFPRPRPTSADLLARLERDDVSVGLRAASALRRVIHQHELRLVRLARVRGWSWLDIGIDLGITRQAAAKRWGPLLADALLNGAPVPADYD